MSAPEADASQDTYAGWVNVTLQLLTNGPVVPVCLLATMEISDLTEHLVATFCLPETGGDGQPVVYRLENTLLGRACVPGKTLANEVEGQTEPELAIVKAATNP